MKPLVLLLIAICASPLHAQDTTRAIVDSALTPGTRPYRDPHRALILGSLIPGAGHVYAGEYFKGVVNYAGTIGTIGMSAFVFVLDDCGLAFLSDCKPHSHFANRVIGGIGIGVGVWTWISSARDAARAAERANARHRSKMSQIKPIIDAPVGLHGAWRVGAAIPW